MIARDRAHARAFHRHIPREPDPRLRKWVDEESEAADVYRRIDQTAELYAEREAALWQQPDLAIALAWRDKAQPNGAWARRYHPGFDAAMAFLDASQGAHDAAVGAEERRRAAELKRARNTVYAVLGVLACVSALAGFAFLQKREADNYARIAESNERKVVAALRSADLAAQDLLAEARSARDQYRKANADSEDLASTMVERSSKLAGIGSRYQPGDDDLSPWKSALRRRGLQPVALLDLFRGVLFAGFAQEIRNLAGDEHDIVARRPIGGFVDRERAPIGGLGLRRLVLPHRVEIGEPEIQHSGYRVIGPERAEFLERIANEAFRFGKARGCPFVVLLVLVLGTVKQIEESQPNFEIDQSLRRLPAQRAWKQNGFFARPRKRGLVSMRYCPRWHLLFRAARSRRPACLGVAESGHKKAASWQSAGRPAVAVFAETPTPRGRSGPSIPIAPTKYKVAAPAGKRQIGAFAAAFVRF